LQQWQAAWLARTSRAASAAGNIATVVSLALEKHLFLNAPRKRSVVSLFGKKLCDINKRPESF
jgi:hypothetical protein